MAQAGFSQKVYQLKSPEGNLRIRVDAREKLHWSVMHKGQPVIMPSAISLQLIGGEVFGNEVKISSSKNRKVAESFAALNYRKSKVENRYNELTLNFKGGYGIIFRAYKDAAAYRFFTSRKGEMEIKK